MLNSNFKDMLNALHEAGADYLLIGAYAMAAHGCPRATGDIDIWVRPTPDNATRVWGALQRFGAPLSRVTVADFHTPDVVYQIGLPPQRIDILTSLCHASHCANRSGTATWKPGSNAEVAISCA